MWKMYEILENTLKYNIFISAYGVTNGSRYKHIHVYKIPLLLRY